MLRDTLVPHQSFHKFDWYKSEHTPWYFHEYTDKVNVLSTGENFIESVDIILRPLVQILHSKNIRTTPSCSGHFYVKEHYDEIFSKLHLQAKLIREKGVEFTNVETGEKRFYHNPEYLLCYNREEFIDIVSDYSKRGIIGFEDPLSFYYIKLMENPIEFTHIFQQNGFTFVYVFPEHLTQLFHVWTEVSRIVE